MDGIPASAVPLRVGKKMKKRKELDALVAHTVNKRAGGVSSHEQLLTESTDEWTPATPTRPRHSTRRRACSTLGRACSVLLVLTCGIATTTVMWLFIDVRQQVTSLRSQLNQVAAAHQGVPDALHECHSLSRDLQKNQTAMLDRLGGFSLLLANLSANLSDVRSTLAAVQLQLKTSSSLVNDHRLVKDLPERVAEFGSKIQDLETTAAALKEQGLQFDSALKSLGANITELQSHVTSTDVHVTPTELAAEKAVLTALIGQVSANLTSVYDSLNGQLNWTVTDRHNDHKAIESLQEMNQNVTARLTTLEGMYTKTTSTSSAPTPLTNLFPSSANAQPGTGT